MASAKTGEFARLLDDLFQAGDLDSAQAQQTEDESVPPTIPFDYLSVVDELHSGRIRVSSETASAEYLATAPLEGLLEELDRIRPEIIAPPLAPVSLPSTDPLDIARELGLDNLPLTEDLARIRRSFAFENHPDRVPAELRERAIVRMQIANVLIDEAQQRLKS